MHHYYYYFYIDSSLKLGLYKENECGNCLHIVIWFYSIASHALKDSRYAHVADRRAIGPTGHPRHYGAEGLEGNPNGTLNDLRYIFDQVNHLLCVTSNWPATVLIYNIHCYELPHNFDLK